MEIQNKPLVSPADFGAFPEKVQTVCRALSDMGIPFTGISHDHADTIEACKEIEAALGAPICKNLFLCNQQKTNFYLLIMPGDKPFKTKYLSKQIGSARLSFAGADAMERLLNVSPGSVSALGLFFDTEKQVRFLIDRDLLAEDFWGFHPCLNTATLKIARGDVTDVFLPRLGIEPTVVDLPAE